MPLYGSSARNVIPLTDAATILVAVPPDRSILTVTLSGDRTLGNPSGSPAHGQTFELQVRQDATPPRTLTLDTAYAYGTSIPSSTLTTVASKMDRLLFEYNSVSSKWDLIAFIKGF